MSTNKWSVEVEWTVPPNDLVLLRTTTDEIFADTEQEAIDAAVEQGRREHSDLYEPMEYRKATLHAEGVESPEERYEREQAEAQARYDAAYKAWLVEAEQRDHWRNIALDAASDAGEEFNGRLDRSTALALVSIANSLLVATQPLRPRPTGSDFGVD
jgi:hypothetical protein